MAATVLLIFVCMLLTILTSSDITIDIDFSDITNAAISKFIFGMNMWTGAGNDTNYTAPYTIIRNGGNMQSTFNWEDNVYNMDHDWYWITQPPKMTWQQHYDAVVKQGMDLLIQIQAMGWVGKSNKTVTWSFSQTKYGKQQKNECDSTSFDCHQDAGNGIWINGSNVINNDPNDANKQITPNDAANYVKTVINRYGKGNKQTLYFEIDNEPDIWHGTHRDVHPLPSTYDELWNDALHYTLAIKTACNETIENGNGWDECMVIAPSVCCWCGYFTSAKDQKTPEHGNWCQTGPDRLAHGNLTILSYIMKESKEYQDKYLNGHRLIDFIDIHYYPGAIKNGTQVRSCNEDPMGCYNRLQAPRSLWDWSYEDPSYLGPRYSPLAVIPRIQAWIKQYNNNIKLSISEYVFGYDYCLTSIIAHAEALAIFAKFDVGLATRWSKPPPNSLLDISWNIFLNYDSNHSSIIDININSSLPYTNTISLNTSTTNISTSTGYAFIKNNKTMFIYLFNKASITTDVSVQFKNMNNNFNFNTNGDIHLYGIDNSTKTGPYLHYVGVVESKPSNTSFVVSMPFYTVRLAIIKAT